MKLGELRELLESLPDDTVIVDETGHETGIGLVVENKLLSGYSYYQETVMFKIKA